MILKRRGRQASAGVRNAKESKASNKGTRPAAWYSFARCWNTLAAASIVVAAVYVTLSFRGQLESTAEPPVMDFKGVNEAAANDRVTTNDEEELPITSEVDVQILRALDRADRLFKEYRFALALDAYTELVEFEPRCARCHFGRAMSLDKQAQADKSAHRLEQALLSYEAVLSLDETPDDLFVMTAKRVVSLCLAGQRQMERVVAAQRHLLDRFPDNLKFKTDLAISYFNTRQIDNSRSLLSQVINADPDNRVALAFYGMIKSAFDDDMEEAVRYLSKGLATDEPVTRDAEFYYHLGSGLIKLERFQEAAEVHKRGAQLGLFLSAMQRSRTNVDELTAQPYWTVEQSGYADTLATIASEWRHIRDEGLALLNTSTGLFLPEYEKLSKDGDWRIFQLYTGGRRKEENCKLAPKTCAVIARAPEAASCTLGQIKFSVMQAGTVVFPHCGPTNCRIRAHLGLQVPEGAHIRVAGETRAWTEGEWLILDDSLEHEVWNDGDTFRLILIVDFWHPELSAQQRNRLSQNKNSRL